MAQSIRRSQFITTYGPGAILEGPNGPRLIPKPDIGLFRPRGLHPSQYEISHPTMSTGLLRGARIFRLPSNAELHKSDNFYIYGTKIFHGWALCVLHKILYFATRGCPRCSGVRKGRSEAIRFVRACKNGHLDDVDWNYLVHRGKSCSNRDAFNWVGGGGSISELVLECPDCKRRVHFGQAYNLDWPCSGRSPETEPFGSSPDRHGCPETSRIIQRQASNLHIPEVLLLFTVPDCATSLHDLLARRPVLHALRASPPTSEQHLEEMLCRLVQFEHVKQADVEEILSYDFDSILGALDDVNKPVPTDPEEIYLNEFRSLLNASLRGYPPVRSRIPPTRVLFKVNPHAVNKCRLFDRYQIRVVPVETLHAVIVQRGYRRLDPDPSESKLVDVGFRDDDGESWYPGAELFGEGIFVASEEGGIVPQGGSATSWQKLYENPKESGYSDFVFRSSRSPVELHPAFVWWHTLSHLLIRALSVDSGYSGTAIRERVYLDVDNKEAKGGVILYAVQQGADGTMGGMISLVPKFDRILRQVEIARSRCSNDPLCYEQTVRPGSYSGSSCYACLLLSETCCEHRNMWLDRKVLMEA